MQRTTSLVVCHDTFQNWVCMLREKKSRFFLVEYRTGLRLIYSINAHWNGKYYIKVLFCPLLVLHFRFASSPVWTIPLYWVQEWTTSYSINSQLLPNIRVITFFISECVLSLWAVNLLNFSPVQKYLHFPLALVAGDPKCFLQKATGLF